MFLMLELVNYSMNLEEGLEMQIYLGKISKLCICLDCAINNLNLIN